MADCTLEGKQSAIDMMVLKALTIDGMHGWGIAQSSACRGTCCS
jgi:hypothetical protein